LAMFRYDASQVLPNIPVPAVVFTGDLDRLIIPETATYIRRHLPNAELVRLEPAGHMSIFERGRELSATLALFAGNVHQAGRTRALQDVVGTTL
jgi:pimeloyl-ACP methyl ester carboxylesterase